MAFSVNINEKDTFPIVILKDESNDCEAEIYSLGAILNAFSVETAKGKMNLIYALSNDQKLSLTTRVTNRGNGSMPLSDGWHPYFTLGGSVNDLQIKFNSREIIEFNHQLIPTGKLLPYNKFKVFKTLGDTFFD